MWEGNVAFLRYLIDLAQEDYAHRAVGIKLKLAQSDLKFNLV